MSYADIAQMFIDEEKEKQMANAKEGPGQVIIGCDPVRMFSTVPRMLVPSAEVDELIAEHAKWFEDALRDGLRNSVSIVASAPAPKPETFEEFEKRMAAKARARAEISLKDFVPKKPKEDSHWTDKLYRPWPGAVGSAYEGG